MIFFTFIIFHPAGSFFPKCHHVTWIDDLWNIKQCFGSLSDPQFMTTPTKILFDDSE